MAHPHNEPDSEFADRIDDLQEIEDSLEAKVEQPVRKTLDEIILELSNDKGEPYYKMTPDRKLQVVFEAHELYAQTKAVEPQQGWVDVKTDPKSGIYNLAFSTDTGRHIAWWDNVSGWKDRSGYKLKDVTHYMPLPEPPTQTNN